MEQLIGYCGVDSGQILLIDPCYVWDDDFALGNEPTGLPYDKACRITCDSDLGAGEVEGGVVTRTAYGDGQYPVYAHMVGNTVHSVTIYFDDDPNVEPRCDFCEETEEWCRCDD